MIFLYLTTLFLVSHATDKLRYDGHQVLKIFPGSDSNAQYVLEMVGKYGLDLWHVHHNDSSIDVNVFPKVLDAVKQELAKTRIPFYTWIHDVQSLIDRQFVPDNHLDKRAVSSFMFSTYHSFSSIENYLTTLDTDNGVGPSGNFIYSQNDIIGNTVEGRQIHITKIYKPSVNPKQAIFVDGGIHAREWISPAFMLYMIDQLKYNPSSSSAIEQLVENYDWYIVPVLNPDGYSYSHTNERLWRKNRRSNSGSTCHGVDLNRNFGYRWDPAIGGSTSPCSDVFSGPGAFSEAESQSVRNFLTGSGINFVAYLTVHSYGQMWLYPWGYTSALPTDWQDLDNAATTATNALYQKYRTRYQVGSSTNVLYSAAGGSDDYALGGAGIKYSYTLELRDTGRYGFVLPTNQIIPTCEETMDGVMAFVGAIAMP